jgi:hypothetical protein
MAIEIRQLIIRAVVEERRERPAGTTGPRSPRSRAAAEPAVRATPPDTGTDREALIAECTRQVLRELRRGRGR